MNVIVNETEIVLEPPQPQPVARQAPVAPPPNEKSRLRPDDLARIREKQRLRLLRVRAD